MAAVNITKIFDGSFDFKRWAKRIVVGGGGVVGAQALSAWACTKWNDNRVSHRISGGYCSDGHLVSRGAAAAHLQRRPDLMNRVARLLQPGADLPSDAYYCILGAPNSGKTHIVRKACEEVGGGVIYMQITVPDMFGQELATAIDYQGGALNVMNMIQNNIVKAVFGGGGGGSGVKDQIDTAIDALVKGSRGFQAHHRRPVVLVLDDVDKLAEKQPGLLEELQSCAKSWSNSGLLRVVFVLSDGPALSQMKRRSAWSRANVSGFVTVDDVGREEALAYLGGRGLSDKDAARIYAVAGGRIGLLSHLATSVADMGIGCEEALHSVVEAAADEFKVAGLLDEGPRRTGGTAAIEALLDAGGGSDEWTGISMTDWSSLVPQPANQKALLASRVFVRHYPHQEVMFGSRPTAIYAQHLLGSSGHSKHHGWRDHHPHSRSGARSHHAEGGSSEGRQAAEGCADCRAFGEPNSRQHSGTKDHGSAHGNSDEGSPAADTAATDSHASGNVLQHSSIHSHDGNGAASMGGTKGGTDSHSPALNVTWNVTPAEEPDSSSDAEVITSRKASVQRHRMRVRTPPCEACESRDK